MFPPELLQVPLKRLEWHARHAIRTVSVAAPLALNGDTPRLFQRAFFDAGGEDGLANEGDFLWKVDLDQGIAAMSGYSTGADN
jgi:hypothetical protein